MYLIILLSPDLADYILAPIIQHQTILFKKFFEQKVGCGHQEVEVNSDVEDNGPRKEDSRHQLDFSAD